MPYLIGSKEWNEKWHIGLIDSDDEMSNDGNDIAADDFSQSSDDSISISISSTSIAPTLSESEGSARGSQSSHQSVQPPNNIFHPQLNYLPPAPQTNPLLPSDVHRPPVNLFNQSDSETENHVVSPKLKQQQYPKDASVKVLPTTSHPHQSTNPPSIFAAQKLPESTVPNLFDHEPPEEQTNALTAKDPERKPVNLFVDDSDEDDDMFLSKANQAPKMITAAIPTKKVNLFDDIDDAEEVNYFKPKEQIKKNKQVHEQPITIQKSNINNLFDDEPPDDLFDILITNATKKPESNSINKGLFEDIGSDGEDDFFSIKKSSANIPKSISALDKKEIEIKKSLPKVEESVSAVQPKADVFLDNLFDQNDDNIFKETPTVLKKSIMKGLFDDEADEDDDDLFKTGSKEVNDPTLNTENVSYDKPIENKFIEKVRDLKPQTTVVSPKKEKEQYANFYAPEVSDSEQRIFVENRRPFVSFLDDEPPSNFEEDEPIPPSEPFLKKPENIEPKAVSIAKSKQILSFLDDDFVEDPPIIPATNNTITKQIPETIESIVVSVAKSKQTLSFLDDDFEEEPPTIPATATIANQKPPFSFLDNIESTPPPSPPAQNNPNSFTPSSIGLFDDLPPDDYLFSSPTSSTKTTTSKSIFYDDFAEVIVGTNSVNEPKPKSSMSFYDHLFSDEPPPDEDEIDKAPELFKNITVSKKDLLSGIPPNPIVIEKKQQTESDIIFPPNTAEQKPKPKKLKENLKINVAALLPGAKLPSFKQKTSEKFEQSSSEIIEDPVNTILVNNVQPTIDSSGRLTSLSKNRVKIKTQRRPSTRQGRQAEYRKSLLLHTDEIVDEEAIPPSEIIPNTEPPTKPQSIEEMFNNYKEDDEPDWFKPNNIAPVPIHIFNELENNDDWFSNKPSIRPVPIDGKEEIFSENVLINIPEEDWLNRSTANSTIVRPPPTQAPSSKSLFSDDDDDDDLFRSSNKKFETPKVPSKINEMSENKKLLGPSKKSMGLFGNDDDDSLFSDKIKTNSDNGASNIKSELNVESKKRVAKPSSKPVVVDLFGDEDDDDSDLFGGGGKLKVKINPANIDSKQTKIKLEKKSEAKGLFGDATDDDDDDLFAISAKSKGKLFYILGFFFKFNLFIFLVSQPNRLPAKKINKKSTAASTIGDPLSDLLK